MFGNVRLVDMPLRESLIFHPASPYGISKAAAHWVTVNYREGYSLFASCGILFNHESCLRSPNYVVKKVINAALKIKLGLGQSQLVYVIPVSNAIGICSEVCRSNVEVLQSYEPEDFYDMRREYYVIRSVNIWGNAAIESGWRKVYSD